MGKPLIIAVTGLAGSGKDMFTDYLVEAFNAEKKRVRRDALAYPLKRIASTLLDKPLNSWDNREFKQKHRHFLTTIADFVKEMAQDETVFAKELVRHYKEFSADVYIVTDLRYDYEYYTLREFGDIVTIKVEPIKIVEGAHITHSSEVGIPEHLVTLTVMNDFTDNLKTEAQCIVKNLLMFTMDSE